MNNQVDALALILIYLKHHFDELDELILFEAIMEVMRK